MANSAFTPTVLQSFQDASISQPGLVNTTTQSFAGDKTFTGNLNVVGNGRGIVPLGAIIAMTTGITGSMAVPASGSASFGWQRADGAAIAGGSTLSGTTPNLSTSVFLRGATTYGGAGGGTATLSVANIPTLTTVANNTGPESSHTHTAGSFATSLSGTFASSGHKHGIAHVHQFERIAQAFNAILRFPTNSVNNNPDNSDSYAQSVASLTNVAAGGGPLIWEYFSNRGSYYTSTPSLCNDGSSALSSKSDGPDATAGLSGSNAVGGTSSAGSSHSHTIPSLSTSGTSGTAFNVVPNYIDVIYLMRVA